MKLVPEQEVAVMFMMEGVGFTVTVTEKGAPMHEPDIGVTV